MDGVHVDIVRGGAEAIREWRRKNPHEKLDLAGAQLAGADLRGADLREADLAGANLMNARAKGADLTGANLEGALLLAADLTEARLEDAAAARANVAATVLEGANLTNADFRRATLSGARLRSANVFRACLRDANLFGADLRRADLREADLREAGLSAAKLVGADLSAARLDRASLGWANLEGAKLKRSVLTEADLSGARLEGAILAETRMSGAKVEATDLDGARLENMDFGGVDLADASLVGARIVSPRGGVFSDGPRGRFRVTATGAYLPPENLPEHPIQDVLGLHPAVRRRIADAQYLRTVSRARRPLENWLSDQPGAVRASWPAGLEGWEWMGSFDWVTSVPKAVWFRLWGLTSRFGQSLGRWIVCSALIMVVFAGLYRNLDFEISGVDASGAPVEHAVRLPDWDRAFFFSVTTLTSFGFGNVTPSTGAARVAVATEVVLGYLMLGGLLSIFMNKMTRLS